MKTLVTILLFAGVSTSQAALFEGTASGTFSNPQGGANAVYQIDQSGTRIRWGDGTYGPSYTPDTSALSLFDSAYSFDFDPTTGTSDAFALSSLSFANGVFQMRTEINAVDIDFNLSLTSPSAIDELFSFGLSITNTLNFLPNSDDSVNFLTMTSTNSFIYDGYVYSLEILGFDVIGGGLNIEDVFAVAENQSDSRNIIAQLTSTAVAVPEPSVTALFGTGLIGLAGFARRRKNKG